MSHCNAISRATFTRHLQPVVTDYKVEPSRGKKYRFKGLRSPDNSVWNSALKEGDQGDAPLGKGAYVRGGR